MIETRKIEDRDRSWIRGVLAGSWGSTRIVTRGRVHRADELPGFLRETRWLTESIALLTEQGFRNLEVEALTFGTSAIVTARKPAGPPR